MQAGKVHSFYLLCFPTKISLSEAVISLNENALEVHLDSICLGARLIRPSDIREGLQK